MNRKSLSELYNDQLRFWECSVDGEGALELGRRSRGTPRIANQAFAQGAGFCGSWTASVCKC